MKHYLRMTLSERDEIALCIAKGYSDQKIAQLLGRSPSTIGREINRESTARSLYRAIPAQYHAQCIASIPHRKRKLETNMQLQQFVEQHLKLRWSPEQIAKRLKFLYPTDMSMQVSHESIYAYIYVHPRRHLKRRLLFYLRRKHIFRRVKNKTRRKTNPIQNFISIDERPPEVNARKIAGHWEGDLIMGSGNRSAIGTLVERKTRLTILVKLKEKDAAAVCQAFTGEFNRLPEYLKKSLTYDQGQEMAEHERFTKDSKIVVYFAHPHSPWERGTSENTNSLVRDFFPRGIDFSKTSVAKLKKVQNMLNDRPRKVLNWQTPNEVFTKTTNVALET